MIDEAPDLHKKGHSGHISASACNDRVKILRYELSVFMHSVKSPGEKMPAPWRLL
jgi:hypothetical protein